MSGFSRVWAVGALVMIPCLSPFVAAQGQDEWRLGDPAGDVRHGYDLTALPTETPLTRFMDIVAVTITDEDEKGFAINVHFDALKLGEAEPQTGYLDILIRFQVDGSPVKYSSYLKLRGGLQTDATTPFLINPRQDYTAYLMAHNEGAMRIPADVAVAEDVVTLWVPKPFLMGISSETYGDDLPIGLPTNIGRGSSLTDLYVWTYGSTGPVVNAINAVDEAPNDATAPPFIFQKPAANAAVRISLGAADHGLAVQPGANQTLPLILTNVASSKRTLQMSYEIDGPADQVAKYKVAGPAVLTLPAEATRNFTFALDVDPRAAATDAVNLTVRAQSIDAPDETGHATAALVPTPALTPTSNTLYMLSGLHEGNSLQGSTYYSAACGAPLPWMECYAGMLSVDPQDPQSTPDQPIHGHSFLNIPPRESFLMWMWRGTSAPIAFDPARPAEIQLALQAEAPAHVNVRAELFARGPAGDTPIFSARGTGGVEASPTALTITAPLQLPDLILDRGSFVALYLEFSAASEDPAAAAAFLAGGVDIIPAESKIVLPLRELPEAYNTTAKAASFQLVPAAGREQFVNPGEARLFNVSLLNQGRDPQRASLKAEVPAGWQVEILPGTQYDLQPGDTVTVGVLAHAPADAKEDDRISILLTATDGQGDTLDLELIAIVAKGVELPDDATTYHADADAQAKLVEAQGSPGPAFLLAVVALLGVALRRRLARR